MSQAVLGISGCSSFSLHLAGSVQHFGSEAIPSVNSPSWWSIGSKARSQSVRFLFLKFTSQIRIGLAWGSRTLMDEAKEIGQ